MRNPEMWRSAPQLFAASVPGPGTADHDSNPLASGSAAAVTPLLKGTGRPPRQIPFGLKAASRFACCRTPKRWRNGLTGRLLRSCGAICGSLWFTGWHIISPASAAPPPGYHLVWHDEFNEESLDTRKWDYWLLGPRRDAIKVTNAISLTGSNLVITTYTVNGNHRLTIGAGGIDTVAANRHIDDSKVVAHL